MASALVTQSLNNLAILYDNQRPTYDGRNLLTGEARQFCQLNRVHKNVLDLQRKRGSLRKG